MAISDTITSMYENVGNVYDVLELAGADLTNVDKNIQNLKQAWEERLLYFLANGTDVVWNNWLPKVTGSGETITLNNTIEAKMDFVYKGNTSQKTTTGKNLFNSIYYKNQEIYTETISISTGNLYCTKLYLKPNTTYTISEALNNWRLDGGWIFVVADTNNQVIRFLQNRTQDYQTTPTTFTTNSDGYVYIGHRYGFNNGGANRILAFLDTVNIQIEEGNTATSFEEYTGGPSPNPDYPQDIQVVSGDNTIKVEGKNLVNLSSLTTETSNGITLTPVFEDNKLQYININGTSTALTVFSLTTYTTTTNNVLNGCFGGSSSTYKLDFWTSGAVYANFNNEDTQLPNNSLGTLRIVVYSGKTVNNVKIYPMISTSGGKYQPYQTPQTYPINIGNIELCKIGDYQDKIAKSTGKNLFDKDSVVGGFVNADGSVGGDTSAYRTSDFIPIQPNTAYYKTSTESPRTKFYDSNKQPLNTTIYQDISIGGNAGTFTTPNNAYYLRFSYPIASVNANGIMINKGNTATPYEPYGKVWYLNKQIGKVVLDGSENWGSFQIESSGLGRAIVGGNNIFYNSGEATILCNKLKGVKYGTSWTNTFDCIASFSYNRFIAYLIGATDLTTFKNKLASGFNVYYVLATPTYEEITDTTLISQLEAIKKSYNTQTSISQVNNDKPFILDVVALGELEI